MKDWLHRRSIPTQTAPFKNLNTKCQCSVMSEVYIKTLEILRSQNMPIPEEDFCKLLNTDKKELRKVAKELDDEGYDIKNVLCGGKTSYILVRKGSSSPNQHYNFLGNIKTPFLICSDYHFGSYSFSEQGFKILMKDIEEYGIRDVIAPGDLLQSKNVHRREASDLKYFNLDEQIDGFLKKIENELPSKTKLHTTLGNHEESVLGSLNIGLNILKRMAGMSPNIIYYGGVAKLKLDNEFQLLMLHGSGGGSYADSYRIQKIYDTLLEKPDIFVMGHLHLMDVISKPPNKHLIYAGTLQRENLFLINKGITTQVGWYIIEEYNGEKDKIIPHRPKVF